MKWFVDHHGEGKALNFHERSLFSNQKSEIYHQMFRKKENQVKQVRNQVNVELCFCFEKDFDVNVNNQIFVILVATKLLKICDSIRKE